MVMGVRLRPWSQASSWLVEMSALTRPVTGLSEETAQGSVTIGTGWAVEVRRKELGTRSRRKRLWEWTERGGVTS